MSFFYPLLPCFLMFRTMDGVSVTQTRKMENGIEVENRIETELNKEEIKKFNEDWADMWKQ